MKQNSKLALMISFRVGSNDFCDFSFKAIQWFFRHIFFLDRTGTK